MYNNKYSGTLTALITPFKDDAIDYNSLNKLINLQLNSNIKAIVPIGTTGESPNISLDEFKSIIRFIINETKNTKPIIVGAGSNSTQKAIELTQISDALGVDGFMHIAPYYNKPNQEGLFLHFSKIAQSTPKPIILYSHPGRCGIEISLETIQRLHEKYPHIIGIKDCTGCMQRITSIRKALGDSFLILTGNDPEVFHSMKAGANGVVSVASNCLPAEISELTQFMLDGNTQEALLIFNRYEEFLNNIFIEPNPVPMKYILNKMGIIQSDQVRLPLAPLSQSNQLKLDQLIQNLNLKEATYVT